MNKLMGFFELRELNIPTIDWKEYTHGTYLSSDILWTVRSAVTIGDDLNLPRKVGVTSDEAISFASGLKTKYGDTIMVIYYPFFIARASGTLQLFDDGYVIECVEKDLWNLVSESKCDMTIINRRSDIRKVVTKDILINGELEEILSVEKQVRINFKKELAYGESVLLEWSFACNCDKDRNTVGNSYLVFYECRTI